MTGDFLIRKQTWTLPVGTSADTTFLRFSAAVLQVAAGGKNRSTVVLEIMHLDIRSNM